MTEGIMSHRINMIVAVSSQGYVWISLTQCNTDENVMMIFSRDCAKPSPNNSLMPGEMKSFY